LSTKREKEYTMKVPLINSEDYVIIGIDIGSTTAKTVVIKDGETVFQTYERHFSRVREKTLEIIKSIGDLVDRPVKLAVSGSAGLGLAEKCGFPFVQEVFASGELVKLLEPDTSAVVELGGEDAKIIFFKGGADERMNGTCAGGTGSFIDQMATLMDITADELDELSLQATKIYPIASRCGVFAKTDIQPLLNQGAAKSDVAASIYTAVVNQTIAGLAQGRRIEGKVMFLGGPLTFCNGLRKAFVKALDLDSEHAIFPEYAKISVALGAAIYADKQSKTFEYDELVRMIESAADVRISSGNTRPLFASVVEYEDFVRRHERSVAGVADISSYSGGAYLGIDCGSTTTKAVLINEENEILYRYYNSNKGDPVGIIKEQLGIIYSLCGDRITIKGSAVTGYGEELIKNAFDIDHGLVETLAHYKAAEYFNPDVDFILDIGGQDIKCFKIRNHAIDSIMLNEACSSGCGSFIETFAKSMGYDARSFAEKAIGAKAPADLGSRCTVFMNSSVKEAQKDGASVEDISAGLSVSVVKNAIYKVIRANSASELGENIVVQGGTFCNDAILKAFEDEIGHEVIRPDIAGLMGAFGAALYAKENAAERSTIITPEALSRFEHKTTAANCKGCTNNCRLTINTFGGGKRFISGNKCEKGAGIHIDPAERLPNLHRFKRDAVEQLMTDEKEGKYGTVGLPLSLSMYEMLPFWKAIFEALGFGVKVSGFGSRKMYSKGQYNIPSDTACYPAKLMHGHIETLIEAGVDAIFYPCVTYNFDEKRAYNHYNCPVVAYYSEVINANTDHLDRVKFLYPYLNINDDNSMAYGLSKVIGEKLGIKIARSEVKKAIALGHKAYDAWMKRIKAEGARAVEYAEKNGKTVMVLAGRPYHVDPEIGHGIDRLAEQLGFVVVSEDSVFELTEHGEVDVLDQWTYHSRLYDAAKYASEHENTEFVQLVSFGCGIDAITSDEARAILEEKGKLYTQIKVDEITNLGAVKIRLRSLLGAVEQRKNKE